MKRNWLVLVPGYPPFPMVIMDGLTDYAGALKSARLIWPNCDVE